MVEIGVEILADEDGNVLWILWIWGIDCLLLASSWSADEVPAQCCAERLARGPFREVPTGFLSFFLPQKSMWFWVNFRDLSDLSFGWGISWGAACCFWGGGCCWYWLQDHRIHSARNGSQKPMLETNEQWSCYCWWGGGLLSNSTGIFGWSAPNLLDIAMSPIPLVCLYNCCFWLVYFSKVWKNPPVI